MPGGAPPDAGVAGGVRYARAAVLGVGLIGGSIAAALRTRGLAARVVGHSPGADAAEALRRGLVDEIADDAPDAVRGADLVVLAAPIPQLPALMSAIAPALAPGALLTDCASTKTGVVDAARAALGDAFARFVPAHPIAGSHARGAAAARADLVDGAWVVVCPHGRCDDDAVARIDALWQALGARTARMDAEAHDRLLGAISHWPHAVAFALSASLARGEFADAALRWAGGGLRDTTRVGASSPELWADILLENRDAVLDAAAAFAGEVQAIEVALRAGDRDALVECFGIASAWRERMPPRG